MGRNILLEEPPAELSHDPLSHTLSINFAWIDTNLVWVRIFNAAALVSSKADAAALPVGGSAQPSAGADLEGAASYVLLPDAEACEFAVSKDSTAPFVLWPRGCAL